MESSQDEQSSEPAQIPSPTLRQRKSTSTSARRRRTPDEYAKAVVAHAWREKGQYICPGNNYSHFAEFLSGNERRSLITPVSQLANKSTFPFAVLHRLAYGPRDPKRLVSFHKAEDLHAFEAHSDLEGPDHGDILFLKGFPSPEWINVVGAKYKVEPEVFRRHLKFSNTVDYFELPGLPSSSFTLDLQIPSIGEATTGTSDRDKSSPKLRGYWQRLGAGDRVGESIVRSFHRHSQQYFSIEQRVSICVKRRAQWWIAIVLLDNGLDLEDCPPGPWFTDLKNIHDIFQPILPISPDIALRNPGHEGVEIPYSSLRSRTRQNSALLGLRPIGPKLKLEAMNQYPFYAVQDLLVFAASAEQQFLNFISAQINIDYDPFCDRDWMEKTLNTYSYHQDILVEHADYLAKIIRQMSDHGSVIWSPAFVSGDKISEEVRKSYRDVERDFEHLHSCVLAMIQQVRDKKDNVSHMQAAVEAKRTFDQNIIAAKLTFFAFLFLPWSLCTAVFGMNVQQLGSNGVHIGYVFAFGVPLFILSLLAAYWVVGRLPW